MASPTLEIVIEDSGLYAIACYGGETLGVIGPRDDRDAIIWPLASNAGQMTAFLADIPAGELPELLDLVIWNMSGHHPLEEWRAELLDRPDAEGEDVQRAVAVIDEYLAPDGSPEAIAAKARAWPDA